MRPADEFVGYTLVHDGDESVGQIQEPEVEGSNVVDYRDGERTAVDIDTNSVDSVEDIEASWAP